MKTTQIISSNGPSPIIKTTEFSAGNYLFFVSGSAWSQTANQTISVKVLIDSHEEGTLKVYTNIASSHVSLIPIVFSKELSLGTHVIELLADSNTEVDINDYFYVTIVAS